MSLRLPLSRQPWYSLLTVAPGLFWLFALPFGAGFFSTWTFANGMESALALLCFSLALLAQNGSESGLHRALIFSCIMGLAILARLDDIFLAASVALFLLWRTPHERRLFQLLALTPVALIVLAYIVYNKATLGLFLPISGATKASAALSLNLRWAIHLFLPVVTGDLPAALRSQSTGYYGFGELGGRLVQMLLPAILSLAELLWLRQSKHPADQFNLVHALATGVLLKAIYNFLFVDAWAQGQWYYTVSIAVANLILVLWVERLLPEAFPKTHSYRITLSTIYFLFLLFAFNVVISSRNVANFGPQRALLEDNTPLRNRLHALGADKIVEFDDGFTSYVADLPSAAGFGLALDPEAAAALKRGRLLDLLYRRGYRVAVGPATYALIVQNSIAAAKSGHPGPLAEIHASEFADYTFREVGGDGTHDGLTYFLLEPVKGP